MRSSGCGFLEEQICHLGLDTTAGLGGTGRGVGVGVRDGQRRRQQRGISRGEERRVQSLKGQRDGESVPL